MSDEGEGCVYVEEEFYQAQPKGAYYGSYGGAYAGYADDDPSLTDSGPADELPSFLREPEPTPAQKTKAFHMQYHKSPLLPLVTSHIKNKTPVEPGSWNERFQRLVDMEDSFEKYDQLWSMAHDFVHAAEAYGRIIIAEMCVPDHEKTIKPTAIGGIAGGEKYIVQDILFKFATDFEGLYGGDAFAMKAAGHDLSGLMAYMRAIEMRPSPLRLLHVPLMALIDFRGYRLVAICLLPIGRDTICYGSYDAGVTVHSSFEECNHAMKDIGDCLNIRGHRSPNSSALIYAPIDIEAHRGRDGKFYVLDFARYMPPQPPSGKWGGTLYELLRPELVRRSSVPLSPDAFSSFGHPEDAKECRKDIRSLFEWLKRPEEGGIIFEYAKLIDSADETESEINLPKTASTEVSLNLQDVLVREMHARGINMRFLGLLRSFSREERVRVYLLQQCLARLWKNELRHLWRDTMQEEKTPSEEPFRRVSAAFFNTVLHSPEYWSTLKQRLMEKFPGALSDEEMAEGFDLRTEYRSIFEVSFSQLFVFLNLQLEKSTQQDFLKACADYREGSSAIDFNFVAGDILSISCRTKHISLVDQADAYAHIYQAERLKNDPATAMRLLQLALAKLLTAMKASGNDVELQRKMCECRLKLLKLWIKVHGSRKLDESKRACGDAISAFLKHLEISSNTSTLLPAAKLLLAQFISICANAARSDERHMEALDKFEDAMDTFKAKFEMGSDESTSVAFLPFLRASLKGLRCFLGLNEKLDCLKRMRVFCKRLIDEFRQLYSMEKLRREHPIVAFSVWWLLTAYAKIITSMGTSSPVPLVLVDRFLEDSNVFLGEALALDANLEQTFLKRLDAKNVRGVLPSLVLAAHSEIAFQAFLSLSKDWSEFDVSGSIIHSSKEFARLISRAPCLTKLKLRGATGVRVEDIKSILQSPISETIARVSLPRVDNLDDALCSLTVTFPKLTGISVRGTNVGNTGLKSWIGLCPALDKLDVSDSLVSVASSDGNDSHLQSWIPSSVRKLDLGAPRNFWSSEAFQQLLESGSIDNVVFLGLAATLITDSDVERAASRLDNLQSLDLSSCAYVSDDFIRYMLEDPTFSNGFMEVWLPNGSWYPVFNDPTEKIVVTPRAGGLMLPITTFSARGKTFAECKAVNYGREIRSLPSEGQRALHKEKFRILPQCLNTIRITGSAAVKWTMGSSDSSAFACVLGVFNPLPTHHMQMHQRTMMLAERFDLNGEGFKADIRRDARSGKLSRVAFTREQTGEVVVMEIPTMIASRVTHSLFPGVTPFLFSLIVTVLSRKYPAMVDGL